jgi:hypothetical protein
LGGEDVSVECGRAIALSLPAGWEGRAVEVELPSGQRVGATAGEGTLVFSQTDLPGLYRVRLAGEAKEVMFAAVPSVGESELAVGTDEVPSGGASAERAAVSARGYWGACLLGAIVLAAVESGLAFYFTQRRAA